MKRRCIHFLKDAEAFKDRKQIDVGDVRIDWMPVRGLVVDVISGCRLLRAYSQGDGMRGDCLINDHLISEVVLPTLRKAMILDDIANS